MLIDSTDVANLLKTLDIMQNRPAEVRTAGGARPPVLQRPLSGYTHAVRSSDARSLDALQIGSDREPQRANVRMSAWLADTMDVIAHGRNVHGASSKLLDDAERLAALMANSDPSKRPQLNILDDGRPSFATSTKDIYIHITIDQPGRLTWFATVKEEEYFGEDIPFDGRRIPPEMRGLLSTELAGTPAVQEMLVGG